VQACGGRGRGWGPLADRSLGVGFDTPAPLDMRFHTARGQSAAEVLQSSTVDSLTQIFTDYGEEPFARQIAERLVSQRRQNPVETTEQLADSVRQVVPSAASRGGRHPATRVFQALRIAVNNELEHVQQAMDRVLPDILKPGGVAVILTFHSLEDRIVKTAFKGMKTWQVLTKKPVESTPAEIRINPRTRSAKLRAAKRKPN